MDREQLKRVKMEASREIVGLGEHFEWCDDTAHFHNDVEQTDALRDIIAGIIRYERMYK